MWFVEAFSVLANAFFAVELDERRQILAARVVAVFVASECVWFGDGDTQRFPLAFTQRSTTDRKILQTQLPAVIMT